MATVTRKFRDNFEIWAANRSASGRWTVNEVEGMRETLRIDLAPGNDQLRAGLTVTVGGTEIPAAIDDAEERYGLWADYFAAEAEAIRSLKGEKSTPGRPS